MLARLLLKFDQESFLNQLSSAGVRGTIGYAAPGEHYAPQLHQILPERVMHAADEPVLRRISYKPNVNELSRKGVNLNQSEVAAALAAAEVAFHDTLELSNGQSRAQLGLTSWTISVLDSNGPNKCPKPIEIISKWA
ncbi:hypothetical protein F2Q69_00007830 [Brassica cretica]|uniref:Uncharacterized protein n=1 Tax=Brassica cretica TaxID=69181 RepID=A0A8S9P035_BRACR|nr:hypothetical protein F2Q69_00007830 [Brassica cretica]